MESAEAQSSMQVPTSDRREPGSFPLATATLPDMFPSDAKPTDAHAIALSWVASFNTQMRNLDQDSASRVFSNLFLEESYWRDMLCLSWDFHTLHGPHKMAALFANFKGGCRIASLELDETSALRSPKPMRNTEGQAFAVQAFLSITTDVGSGTGIVKLLPIDGTWKAFTLFTCLEELRGHEELVGKRRPHGAQYPIHKTWLDCRQFEEKFEDGEQPEVLIVGMFPSSNP